MAKVALLIGVSEYQNQDYLKPLPAAAKDVEAMKQVLQHQEIGGFDRVHTLLNPEPVAMQQAIENLFTDDRDRDDLLLLFFSGHGIKDENGTLYFSTRITQKNHNGRLTKATAVPARFVHDIMRNSSSRRLVVILDCCFSGAFAQDMTAKNDGFVNIRNELGGEGRAVLTSSTSTQYSFDDTYTRYIVEGLKTGAADRDQDGWISVDELHDYAKQKVQESVPAMKPEIYAIKEGYKIQLAKAPTNDPNLKYRQEVEFWAKQGSGEIIPFGYATLDALRVSLKLTTEAATAIEAEVLEPYRIYKERLQKYEDVFRKQIESEFPVSDNNRDYLKRYQHILGLRDEDVALIENRIFGEINRQYQEKLQKYEDEFRQRIESEFPVSDNTRYNLKRFQHILGLRDEDAALIENRIFGEINRQYQEKLQKYEDEFRQTIKRKFRVSAQIRAKLRSHQQALKLRNEDVETIEKRVLDARNRYLKNLIPFLVVGGLVAVIAGILVTQWRKTPNLEQEISLGEDILLAQASSDKEEGVKAFAKKDFDNAIKSFESSLSKHPDDPEALIYKNNAEAAKTRSDLKIAVSIPIGTNLNVAAEILRGVAQAQNGLNKKGGINGKKLWVAIANDNNNPEDAKNIATKFVKNSKYSSVLAVVGHNSSEASLAARPVYEKGNLVMITPTSDANQLPNDPPIFHTMPTLDRVVNALSEHAKKAGVNKIAICYDLQAPASVSFKDKFIKAFAQSRVASTNCNLSEINSDSQINTILGDAKKQANGILVVPGVRSTIDKAIKMAAAAKKHNLKLFGSSTINTSQTLEQGQGIEGMIVAVPWNPTAETGKSFAMQATQLWGKNVDWRSGNLTWRTAMTYDATQAIIQGIKTCAQASGKASRECLKNDLARKDFSVNGVTGKVHFQGDRNGEVSLLQLKPINSTVTGYDSYAE
jgi:branched-chain amino acid transport system substrate-binding protein